MNPYQQRASTGVLPTPSASSFRETDLSKFYNNNSHIGVGKGRGKRRQIGLIKHSVMRACSFNRG